MQLLATDLVRDEGTVVVFKGTDRNSIVWFAVDHRFAQSILDTLDIHGECYVTIEPWQIIDRVTVGLS